MDLSIRQLYAELFLEMQLNTSSFPFWDGSFKWGSRFTGQINPKTQLWHIWANNDLYVIPEYENSDSNIEN